MSIPRSPFVMSMLLEAQHTNIKHPTGKQARGFSFTVEDEDDRDSPVFIKPLNSHFVDFADAVRSYMNSRGYGATKKAVDGDMVEAFCNVMGIEYVTFNTDSLLRKNQFFSTTEWLSPVLYEHQYQALGDGLFVRLDEGNRPVSMVKVARDETRNMTVQYNGESGQAEVIYSACRANYAEEEKEGGDAPKAKAQYVSFDDIDRDGDPIYKLKEITREGELLPEYYPYLDGNIKDLLRDFIESDESVLIFMGPPGTGKSSALMYAVNELNLLPIHATKATVVGHPEFVSKLFYINDKYAENRKDSASSKRKRQFTEASVIDTVKRFHQSFSEEPIVDVGESQSGLAEKITDRIPIAVIEDADGLMRPRTEGNLAMGQLLNEVDGIGSNFARKVIFATNLSSKTDIDEALMRDGRCFEVVQFRLLTPDEAVAARAAHGLPPFEEVPTTNVPLATALRKPRKRYVIGADGKAAFGFNSK